MPELFVVIEIGGTPLQNNCACGGKKNADNFARMIARVLGRGTRLEPDIMKDFLRTSREALIFFKPNTKHRIKGDIVWFFNEATRKRAIFNLEDIKKIAKLHIHGDKKFEVVLFEK